MPVNREEILKIKKQKNAKTRIRTKKNLERGI
jgi:hypothetical protein